MKDCNADAKTQGLKGDDRKKFMSTCLSKAGASAADGGKTLSPQQSKMKDCSQQAKTQGLKGDARKTFMSDCLKK